MKPARSQTRWVAVALLVLAAVSAQLASGFPYVGYIGRSVGLAVYSGQLELSYDPKAGGMPFNYAGREGFQVGVQHFLMRPFPELYLPQGYDGASRGVAYVPVWMLFVIPLLLNVRKGAG